MASVFYAVEKETIPPAQSRLDGMVSFSRTTPRDSLVRDACDVVVRGLCTPQFKSHEATWKQLLRSKGRTFTTMG